MAKEQRLDVRAFTGSRTSLIVASLFSGLSLACSEMPAPTELSEPAAGLPLAAAGQGLTVQAQTVPGRYIVTFTNDVVDVPGLAKQLAAQHGGQLLFTYTSAIRGFAIALPSQAVEALQNNPQIASVEPDEVAQGSDVQTPVPAWGLARIDQRSLPLVDQYIYSNQGSGVNVYILDTGIRLTHREFGGRAMPGFTAYNDQYGTTDCNGHGTNVAGIVGAATYGVAKAVNIYSVRVLDCSNYGSYSSIIAGIDWVTKNRVLPAVANLSLGGSFSSTVNTAVQNAINAGVVVTVAAMNNSADACNYSPASVASALTVGASDRNDVQASFSDYGKCVDLYAPGVAIMSTFFSSDSAYAGYSGTSQAAPHVAGAAALYLTAHPTATPAEVAAALTSNATANTLTSLGTGSPNKLLYTGFIGSAVIDSTVPQTPVVSSPPPAVDQPPVAAFSVSCSKAQCSFDASSSIDDKGIATYSWTFGDGVALLGSTSARATHSYGAKGSYSVSLTVTDTAGQTSTTTQKVTIRKI